MDIKSEHTLWSGLKNAIVVCGHAIFLGGPNLQIADQPGEDQHWVLQSFQKGEGKDYITHIKAGVIAASTDETSLLIFSGGQTRAGHILSEAQGYHNIASIYKFWGQSNVEKRVTTEEFSRDSYDNVVFSICRFRECTGTLPEKLTMVSWSLKEERIRLHAQTIRWPMDRFSFIGIRIRNDVEGAIIGEGKTAKAFTEDMTGYGLNGGLLGRKKMERNPYRRQHGYETSCPELRQMLNWRGTSIIPPAHVPW